MGGALLFLRFVHKSWFGSIPFSSFSHETASIWKHAKEEMRGRRAASGSAFPGAASGLADSAMALFNGRIEKGIGWQIKIIRVGVETPLTML